MRKTNPSISDDITILIKECLGGNRASQEALYRLHCRKMMGICMWYAKNKEEAEEILQDGFVRVFTYLNKYSGEGSLEGWIRQIMVNAALSKFKSKKAAFVKQTVLYNERMHDVAEEHNFIAAIDEKELLKMIQTLTPAYRMVFNLYVFEGMKHREIAEHLGISEGTSKSNFSDARLILKKKMMAINYTGVAASL